MFRSVAHINPVDQKLLDLVTGKVRILFLDALNGLFEIKSFCIRPDKFALPGVELHVLQQIPKGVGYLYELLILGRIPQREELFEEGIIRENTDFRKLLALLAHDAGPHIGLSRRSPSICTRLRLLRPSHVTVQALKRPGHPMPQAHPHAQRSGASVRIPIMSTIRVNE